jgi:hypothetical protein
MGADTNVCPTATNLASGAKDRISTLALDGGVQTPPFRLYWFFSTTRLAGFGTCQMMAASSAAWG